MVAWAAIERLRAGDAADPLGVRCRPRWPLEQVRNMQIAG
jgi:N6-L-threonylcarbamoyladenine synthase